AKNNKRDNSRILASVIQKEIGKKRSVRSLYGGAYRIFGSWDRALLEAKINPELHRKCKFGWNVRQVRRILNVLYHMKIPVNAGSVAKDFSEQTKTVIFDFTGRKGNGHQLYKLGHEKFGSWDATLKFSGFMLSEVRRSGSPCERNQDKVIDIIRMFHKNNIALNHGAMAKHSSQLKYFVEHNFGSAVSGSSVLGVARELFGSWDQALWEAGLDSSAIRLRSRSNISNLPVISHQVEDIKRDGEFGLVTYMGESKTPEEVLEAKENSRQLQEAVNMVDDTEKELVDRIIDAVMQIHHYKDQAQLIHFIVEELNHDVTKEKVQEIFLSLAGNLTAPH
ncbi:MAG: hypothetical protein ABL958_08010, partial [Bdellovibrionia bacterium]